MRKFFEVIFLSYFFSCSGISIINTQANVYSPSLVVHPGKIIQIKLPEGFKKDSIICGKNKFPVSNNTSPYFVYAESYFSDLKPKTCVEKNVKINILVKDKKFPFEELKVDSKRVELNKKDLERVQREQLMLNKIYKDSLIDLVPKSNFKLPINTKVTSEYGKRRLFNNQRKGQHLGIDFRAKIGKEIYAANDGKVVLAQNLFYTGNTVILYHGLGIFTVYGHLSKLNILENTSIKKGEVLGLSGNTGRVTGPHLHWGVKVNGEWVNGRDLLELDFNF